MRRTIAVALLAAGCRRAPADVRDAGATPAAADASLAAPTDAQAPLPLAGWVPPARRASTPDAGTATTRESFMAAHGLTSKPDAACWSGQTNLCTCDRAIAAGAVDVLVCKRFHEGATGSRVHIVTHSVLYAAARGALKLVLDVPTAATVEAEDTETGSVVGNVSLRAEPSQDGVMFVDEWETDSGPWCPQAVAGAKAWPAIRRAYGDVCASAGRYVWASGRLVKGG